MDAFWMAFWMWSLGGLCLRGLLWLLYRGALWWFWWDFWHCCLLRDDIRRVLYGNCLAVWPVGMISQAGWGISSPTAV